MKTTLKLLAFIAFLVLVRLLISSIKPEDQEVSRFCNTLTSTNENSVAFVGSSRIKRGIDPTLLKEHFPDHEFINLGSNAETFISNYLITSFLLENTKCGVVFMELSPIKKELTYFNYKVLKKLRIDITENINLFNSKNRIESLKFRIDLQNEIITKDFFAKEDLKSILKPNSQYIFGFLPEDQNHTHDVSSILTEEDLNAHFHFLEHNQYTRGINALLQKANENKKSLYFLLPVTNKNNVEKEIVIPIYNSLEAKYKLVLDTKFFTSIRNKEYLLNTNHFNTAGSKIYTNELARLIRKQEIILPPNP